jgi:hypothetical protein
MQEWIAAWQKANGHVPFTVYDVAGMLEIPTRTATGLIQAYQQEQWRPDSETAFVIKRQGRTRAAVWSAGVRKKDVKQVNLTFYEDMTVKARRAFQPTLERIAVLNPRQAEEVTKTIDGTLEGAFRVMRAALGV